MNFKGNNEKHQLRQTTVCDYYVRPLLESINHAFRDNISNIFREHFLTSFHAFHLAHTIEIASDREIQELVVNLPPQKGKKKKTLILDLDETLIHCNESLDVPYDCLIDIPMDDEMVQAGINIRPYAIEFLEKMSQMFEILVFTASQEIYATEVVKQIDPQNQYISKSIFREKCLQKGKVHVKDLRIFKNRSIKDLILVDNSCYSFIHNINNGVPIISFYDDKEDQELKSLANFLASLTELEDVRPVIKSIFKYKQYSHHENPDELLREIY